MDWDVFCFFCKRWSRSLRGRDSQGFPFRGRSRGSSRRGRGLYCIKEPLNVGGERNDGGVYLLDECFLCLQGGLRGLGMLFVEHGSESLEEVVCRGR